MPGNEAPTDYRVGLFGASGPLPGAEHSTSCVGSFFKKKNAQGPSSFLGINSSDFLRGHEPPLSRARLAIPLLSALPALPLSEAIKEVGPWGRTPSLPSWLARSKDGSPGEKGVWPYLYFPLGGKGLDAAQ